MINLQVITIISLNIISIVFAFLGGFFFGRLYEARKINNELQQVVDDLEAIHKKAKKSHLKGGDDHGKNYI